MIDIGKDPRVYQISGISLNTAGRFVLKDENKSISFPGLQTGALKAVKKRGDRIAIREAGHTFWSGTRPVYAHPRYWIGFLFCFDPERKVVARRFQSIKKGAISFAHIWSIEYSRKGMGEARLTLCYKWHYLAQDQERLSVFPVHFKVRRILTREVVKTIEIKNPTERSSEKILWGLLKNMNTDEFFVDTSEVDDFLRIADE